MERMGEICLIRGREIDESSFSLPVVVDMEPKALKRFPMEDDSTRSFDDDSVIDVVGEAVLSF